MKKLARAIVAVILGYQVRRLYKKGQFRVIGVVGSIGKTSTKLAIANVLQNGFRVRYQEGNYNDLVSVPLVFFGQKLPNLFNPLAWMMVFWRNEKQLRSAYPFDVVVLELGSDGPGQIAKFESFLKLEIAVITAITPEHMQTFKTLDNVAHEELSVGPFTTLMIANKDLCDNKYISGLSQMLTYGVKNQADYTYEKLGIAKKPQSLAEQYSILAAAAVAYKLGLEQDKINAALLGIKPFAGRMQKLDGVNNSTIIDDSYNSSPEAAKMALDELYSISAPQKIAVLGNMNELGDYSAGAHEQIGNYCDPKQLEMIITIGPDANNYLAKAAEAKGCRVERFDSPYKAGDFIRPLVKPGAVILVKGSQNKVFAEETIKSLLANPADSSKLVRQEAHWMNMKRQEFKP